MYERRFAKFFSSPAGLSLALLGVAILALYILWLTMRVFSQLLNPAPYIDL